MVLFYNVWMARLREDGRCAIILPLGTLFQKGVGLKVREKLLSECNLHTIIRMPKSIFSPYTDIASNILFFEKGSKTKEIWFYQMDVRKGLKTFSKTKPLMEEDFKPIIDWMKNKKEGDKAWKISIDELSEDYNLNIKNPKEIQESIDGDAHEIIDKILLDEKQILETLNKIKALVNQEIPK